jgi:cell division protein FtsQ
VKRRAGRRVRPSPRIRVSIDPVRLRRLARVVGSAVVLGLVILAAVPLVVRAAHTHPYFAVREIAVRHRGQLDESALRQLTGVVVGMNIWDVDTDDATTRLYTDGWVRSASVRRELPNRIVVQVREHRPVAVLAVGDESPGLYYLAMNGRIFAPVAAGDGRDLPLITGLVRADLAGTDAFGPRGVRRALVLLRHADRYKTLGIASEVHVDRARGLTLMPTRPALPIEIGWGQYDEKLARLAEVMPSWAGREAEMRAVSCVFEDEVIVRTRGSGPAASGGASGRKPGAARGKAAHRAATGA